MRRSRFFSRGTALAAAAVLSGALLALVVWRQAAARPGPLPTLEQLQRPFTPPAPGGKPHGMSSAFLSGDQAEALRQGNTITIAAPDGGSIVFSPAGGEPPHQTPAPAK
jgi:hypothetical protein